MDSKASTTLTWRFIAIAKNIRIFFAYELGFNRCIDKVKEFYTNSDPNFLTLIDLDAKSLIKRRL